MYFDFVDSSPFLIAFLGYVGSLIWYIRNTDLIDKMNGKKTFRLKGISKFLVIRATKKIKIINEYSDIANEKNIAWEKCRNFKNSVTRFALFWQIFHHIYFWALTFLVAFRLEDILTHSAILEYVLIGVYFVIIVFYRYFLYSKRKKFKSEQLSKQLKTQQLETQNIEHFENKFTQEKSSTSIDYDLEDFHSTETE